MKSATFRSILVPLDGSDSANAALAVALRLAAPDGTVVILHVIDRTAIAAACGEPFGGGAMLASALDGFEDDERAIFASARRAADAAGIRCTTVALDGPPSARIVASARAEGVDAIAMGSHGRRGVARLVLGSTAAAVLDGAELPTFVVDERSAAELAPSFRQIVVAVDGSPASRNAVALALRVAACEGSRIFFVHVAAGGARAPDAAELADALRAASDAGVPCDSAVVHGDPVDAIAITAEAHHADLLVVGAHGRRWRPFPLGSISESLVRTSPVPVLVAPPEVHHGATHGGSARPAR